MSEKNGSPLLRKAKIQTKLIKKLIVANSSMLADRAIYQRGMDDPRRDMNKECGWPEELCFDDFMNLYTRFGIAARVVNVYPDECFAVDFEAYEGETPEDKPFEQDVKNLMNEDETNILHWLHMLDVHSGIGQYGIMLIGIDDGKKLSEPANEALPGERRRLLYFRTFDEGSARIKLLDTDERSSRHGKPFMYTVKMIDTSKIEDTALGEGNASIEVDVHWTRVIHAADNCLGGGNWGIERMRPVYNNLLDTRKTLGGSNEMFYKGGFPGFSLELDPRLAEVHDIEIDEEDIEQEVQDYMNGLERFLMAIGYNVKSLAPQVANPQPTFEADLQAIAMAIGVPLRIFMGAEQAQLASGQDVRTWNRRLKKRLSRYVTPKLVRPLINRLIWLGCVRPPDKYDPKMGVMGYNVWWPDVNMPTEDEQSQIADRRAAALMKYMMSNAWQVMQFRDFLYYILGFDRMTVNQIMKSSKKEPELKIKSSSEFAGPADSGSGGNSPSNPPKGGKISGES